jgi:hypothetical protein
MGIGFLSGHGQFHLVRSGLIPQGLRPIELVSGGCASVHAYVRYLKQMGRFPGAGLFIA